MRLGEKPDPHEYQLTETNGLHVGLEKSHLTFLHGVRIDWLAISEEVGGFHIHNPNDKPGDTDAAGKGESAPAAAVP